MRRASRVGAIAGLMMALATASFSAGAAEVKPHIEDPVGDANFINDQGTGDGSTEVTAADAGTVSDLLAITFSNDAKNLYVDIRTEAAPPAASGVGFRIGVNPEGAGGTRCIFFEAFYPGANNALTTPVGHVRDACGGETTEVVVLGTQMQIPRSLNAAFAKGKVLVAPQAQSFLYSGTYPQGVAGPMVDTTRVGTDFKFVDKKKKK